MVVRKMVKPLTIGVDIGGTKLNVALVDGTGHTLCTHKSLIQPGKDPDRVIADILAAIRRFRNITDQKAIALGIGVAAQVDLKGVVQTSPNLGWHNFPLKKKMEKRLGLPVVVTNDANAATWGEWRYGSGRGVDDFVLLFVGTGVGGGIITGGRLLTGCTNGGGELGHLTIVINGRKCHCPNIGCLEAYTGGWAIAERAQEAVRIAPKKGERLVSLAGNVERVTAATVSKAYREGDLLAHRLVEETGKYLAAGVVSIVNIFNPCVLTLGGGVIEGIPELIQIVKENTRKRALEASIEELKIVKSALGVNAGVIGAAALAQDFLDNAP